MTGPKRKVCGKPENVKLRAGQGERAVWMSENRKSERISRMAWAGQSGTGQNPNNRKRRNLISSLFKQAKVWYNKIDISMHPDEEVANLERSKIRSSKADLLMQAMLTLESEDEAYRFFEDLCTIAELRSMAQRLEVAMLLRKGETYQEIARVTGASTATISRVNRALTYGADGYTRVLNKLEENGLIGAADPAEQND